MPKALKFELKFTFGKVFVYPMKKQLLVDFEEPKLFYKA